jgi:hypothetical protein
MKRCLLCSPLLVLAPAGWCLGYYVEGTGLLPYHFGTLVSAASLVFLPWVISAVFLLMPKVKWAIRIPSFVCALVVQCMSLVAVQNVPPPNSTMRGISHRLRREFSSAQLREIRDCADHLRQKFHDGTLAVSAPHKDDYGYCGLTESAVVVADTELPAALRGRFSRVFIQKMRETGKEQVVFALGQTKGILCDLRKEVHDTSADSMADGVHAYQCERL